MKSSYSFICILFLSVSILMNLHCSGQELSRDLLPDMVQLVDGQIDMSPQQEEKFLQILENSYEEVMRIKRSQESELDKMAKILTHQERVDELLKSLFTEEQYSIYKGLLYEHTTIDNTTPQISTEMEIRARELAGSLELDDDKESKFVDILVGLDKTTEEKVASSLDKNSLGVELLTEVLVADIQIIRLMGEEKYASFFNRRTDGALTGMRVEKGADISTVLNFYKTAQTLKLTDEQIRSVIRHVLQSEEDKAELKAEFSDQPALLQEKILLKDQRDLLGFQKILDDKQWDIFIKLMSQN